MNITGSRPDDVQERRQSTAAKIIIGREEIDRFGDSTLGDVLRRLPGVTIQGRPGRGGEIRLRGLGSGYTQILLDGERVPPGFSLDSLSPDQIERIEILRAPTAETGARAIAGTINIITREGYTRRVNDLRLNAAYENGKVNPSASWTRNISEGAWTINYTLSAYYFERDNSSTTTTVDTPRRRHRDPGAERGAAGAACTARASTATARLQWRGEGGVDIVTLMPIVYYNHGSFARRQRPDAERRRDAACPTTRPSPTATYASSLLRLNGQWNHRLASGGRIEFRAGARPVARAGRTAFAPRSPTARCRASSRTTSARRTPASSSSIKLIESIFEGHSLVSGAEVEGEPSRRDQHGAAERPAAAHRRIRRQPVAPRPCASPPTCRTNGT